jgi:hypothetical protein
MYRLRLTSSRSLRAFNNLKARTTDDVTLDPSRREADRVLSELRARRTRELANHLVVEMGYKRAAAMKEAELFFKKLEDADWHLRTWEALVNVDGRNENQMRAARKQRQQYEKSAYGIASSTTNKGRDAAVFLEKYEQFRRARIFDPLVLRPRFFKKLALMFKALNPIFEALNTYDDGFLEALVTAVRFRKRCQSKGSRRSQAARARRLLIEAALFQGPKGSMTWREAQENFWPEYFGDVREGTDEYKVKAKNFRVILKQCGFAWKRGKGGKPKRGSTKKTRPYLYSRD